MTAKRLRLSDDEKAICKAVDDTIAGLRAELLEAQTACNKLTDLNAELVAALRELHAIDERKLQASDRRVYKIGHSKIKERIERNRALLRADGVLKFGHILIETEGT